MNFCIYDRDTFQVLRTGICTPDTFALQAIAPNEVVAEMEFSALPAKCRIVDGEVVVDQPVIDR